MNAVCISASNIQSSRKSSISYRLCKKVEQALSQIGITCTIFDLREYNLSPCSGCGKCFDGKRCCRDKDFNTIYSAITCSDSLFIVSPHYAPVPAKLCMLLEKMEEITFLHWWKDPAYQSEVYHLPTGIISHGGGSDWALPSYKAMVNDTIANALDTIQCKVIPYNAEWNTGISLPVQDVIQEKEIFPVQIYDWKKMDEKIQEYVTYVAQAMQ